MHVLFYNAASHQPIFFCFVGEISGLFPPLFAPQKKLLAPKTDMLIGAYQAGLSTGGRQRAYIAVGRPPVGKPCNKHNLTSFIIPPQK